MKNILKGFALSISMLTTLPFFKVHDFFKGINGYAVMFFPYVGLLMGFIVTFAYCLLNSLIEPIHLGIIIFALTIILSGALHVDGFADTVDGLYVKKEDGLKVMSDPHVGAMGMIITATFLILKASSLAHLEDFYLLPIVMMLSRFNAVLSIYFYPYVGGGMAKLAKDEFNKEELILSSIFVLALSLYISWALLLTSIITLLLINRFFIKRYAGLSGDMYGFNIEVTELILLNVILFGLA